MRRLVPLLALLAAPAAAKPITVRVDRVVAGAMIIAEVDVLDVGVAEWGGGHGYIKVRVTGDPRRILRGARFCGAELELVPFPDGPGACTRELGIGRLHKRKPLLVIDAQRVVHLTGHRHVDDYVVHGWCDFRPCLLMCDDKELGHPFGERSLRISGPVLRKRFEDEEVRFWAFVAPYLLGVVRRLPAAELERLLAELGADERARRDRAHRLLLERGRYSTDQLRAALDDTVDPEQRRQIQAVLDELDVYARAADVAKHLTDPEQRAWVVRTALPRLKGDERKAAEKFLRLPEPDPDAQREPDDDQQDD